MRGALTRVAVILAGCFGTPSFAATVSVVQGQVLVNRGQGYEQVVGTTSANPGDTIVVNPGGSAQVVYPDGCTVPVVPGSVVSVASQSPCLVTGATETTGVNATTLAIGAAVVAGGVGAVILLNQKDKSASP